MCCVAGHFPNLPPIVGHQSNESIAVLVERELYAKAGWILMMPDDDEPSGLVPVRTCRGGTIIPGEFKPDMRGKHHRPETEIGTVISGWKLLEHRDAKPAGRRALFRCVECGREAERFVYDVRRNPCCHGKKSRPNHWKVKGCRVT